MLRGEEPVLPPTTTMLGALYRYMREAEPRHFQPMNANFGLVDELPKREKDKRRKRELIAERAVEVVARFVNLFGPGAVIVGPPVDHLMEAAASTREAISDPDMVQELISFDEATFNAFTDRLFADPAVTRIQTDPSPRNARAIRSYAKAGFSALGEVVTPDGPALLMVRERGA